jgi:FkbM family methyltransferase
MFAKYTFGILDCLVLDIGANDGQFTALAAVSGCRVVTFEPQRDCLRSIFLGTYVNGAKENLQVIMINKAVHHVQTTVNIDIPSGCRGNFRVNSSKGNFHRKNIRSGD